MTYFDLVAAGLSALIAAAPASKPAADPGIAATQLFREGKLAEACPLFEEATRAHPRDAKAWNDLALCTIKLGKADPAAARRLPALSESIPNAIAYGDGQQRLAAYFNWSLVEEGSPACPTGGDPGAGTFCHLELDLADDGPPGALVCCELPLPVGTPLGEERNPEGNGWVQHRQVIWAERCDASCRDIWARWCPDNKDCGAGDVRPAALVTDGRRPNALAALGSYWAPVRSPEGNSIQGDEPPAGKECRIVATSMARGIVGAICDGRARELPILPARTWLEAQPHVGPTVKPR